MYNVLDGMVFLLSTVPDPKYIVEDVPTGVPLHYRVAAVDSTGIEGIMSSIVEVTGKAILLPYAFRNVW